MKFYFKTKHEKDSARITGLIAMILILLIFIVGPKYMDPPLEYGVAVNFGTTDFGSGRIQPKQPIKAEQEAVKPPQKVEESKPVPSEPKETKEEVLTSEQIESIAIEKQKAEEAKIKAKADAKAKKEAERIEKERKEQEAKKKYAQDLAGSFGKTDGTDSGSEGDDNKPGDKGNPLGGPYKPYDGIPGLGNGGVGYGLYGRGTPGRGNIEGCENEYGKIVVEIIVNQNGQVISATAGVKGSTNITNCLKTQAEKLAKTYKWPRDPKAPSRQFGKIVVNFTPNN